MNIQIQKARQHELDEILVLLEIVRKDLHKKNIMQWQEEWNHSIILKEIVHSKVFLVQKNNSLIGTFSIKIFDTKQYNIPSEKALYLYRIALLPQYQGQTIGKQILEYVKKYAESEKMNVFLDCWAGNKHLRSFYKKNGFEWQSDIPEDDYMISVFELKR